MNIDATLASLEGLRLAEYVRQSLYVFPFLESLHVVGLTMVFGSIAVLDLRLLGMASVRCAPNRSVKSLVSGTVTVCTSSVLPSPAVVVATVMELATEAGSDPVKAMGPRHAPLTLDR